MNCDAVIIGAGIGGLNLAYQLVKRGMTVTVIESRGRCGGLVVGAPLAGRLIDLGAESFARRSAYCAALCAELDLETCQPGGSSWVWSADDRVFPLPYGVLGIPASLDDPQVATALGAVGLARARQDVAGVGFAGDGSEAQDLATLVRTHLGDIAYQVLVRPVAGGIYSAEPESLSVDVVAPGLRAALAQTGSLVRAAAMVRSAAPPGAVVSSVVGGLFRLPEELVRRVQGGGQVLTRTVACGLRRVGGQWQVDCAAAAPGPTPADPPVPSGAHQTITAPRVIVAADGRAAMGLLRGLDMLQMTSWQLPIGAQVSHVVLAAEHDGLTDGPRGSGLLVAPRTGEGLAIGAKALTHMNIKWPHLGQDVHYLRVSYGRPGEAVSPTVADGLADASTLLGVSLTSDNLRGSMVVHWNDSLPPPTPAHRARVIQMRSRIADIPGLGVTGAWVAGNGLAAVLADADAEAARIAQ